MAKTYIFMFSMPRKVQKTTMEQIGFARSHSICTRILFVNFHFKFQGRSCTDEDQ